jgi:hypothetical protein
VADTMNGPELHPDTVKLAQGANYGSITTMLPSGRLQTQMIWVHTDGERLVVNTEVHRQKFKNLEQDSRVTLTIRDEQDPYRYAEGRGGRGGTEGPRPYRRALAEVPRPGLRP